MCISNGEFGAKSNTCVSNCTFYYTTVAYMLYFLLYCCSIYMADGLWVDGFIRVVGTCGIIYMGNVFHYNGGFWHTLGVGSEF